MIKKILIPIDGSDCSIKAIARAKNMGAFYKADLTVLTVVDAGKFTAGNFKDQLIDSNIKEGKRVLEQAKEMLKDYPYKVFTSYKMGDVSEEIINMADENHFDLIVMGSRGLGTFKRALIGGVSHRVVNHVTTSVYLVK